MSGVYYQPDWSITTSATNWNISDMTKRLEHENDILKQRCSFHASFGTCQMCMFKCKYRKEQGEKR